MFLFLGHLGVTNEEKIKFGIYARNYVRKRLVRAKCHLRKSHQWSIIGQLSQLSANGEKKGEKRDKLLLGEFL